MSTVLNADQNSSLLFEHYCIIDWTINSPTQMSSRDLYIITIRSSNIITMKWSLVNKQQKKKNHHWIRLIIYFFLLNVFLFLNGTNRESTALLLDPSLYVSISLPLTFSWYLSLDVIMDLEVVTLMKF